MREAGKAELAHSDFLKKVEKVLGGGHGKFSSTYLDASNRQSKCYQLPKREASLTTTSPNKQLTKHLCKRSMRVNFMHT
jgi:hypothetical protein